MNQQQNLVNLLSNFPNVSTLPERQAFINTVGLSKLAQNIDIAGNTHTFFNTLIDVVVKTDGPQGLLNFMDNVIASGWVGGIDDLKKLKTQLQNLDSRQWRDDFGYVTIPDPVTAESCPYQGLFAFGENDAQYFFGREAVADQLVTAAESRSLVAVIGASGSGKSSAVFAGLIPRLRKKGKWAIASFRPGNTPFYHLASALVSLLEAESSEVDKLVETKKLRTALLGEDLDLSHLITRIAEKQDNSRVLLVADQFEELYALCREKKLRQSFLGSLLAATNFTLVLTLRADFCGYALSDRSFTDALKNANFLLAPMNRQELEEAIIKPAKMLDVELEAGLSDRILEAVGEEPGNLPLLQFALAQLWEKQSRGKLTHVAYDEIGGVEQALVKYADEEYNKLEEQERERVRRAFIQLVSPGEGTQDTRRLATAAEVGVENWDLIKRLADSRLVVTGSNETGEETVEVIHEALIREWGTLGEWIEGSREFRTWQKRLRERMREWEKKNKDEGELLRGASLLEAQEWFEKRLEELSDEEQEFIRLSGELRETEEKKRRQRRQEKTWGLAAFLLITGLLLQQAFIGNQIAKNSKMRGRIKAIDLDLNLTQNLNAFIKGIKLGKELKDASWATTETRIQAINMLRKIVYWQGFKDYKSLNHKSYVNGVAFNRNGELIASASSDYTAKVWKEDGTLVATLEGHSAPIYRVTFGYHQAYGDEELIATASRDTTAKIWTLDKTEPLLTVKHNSPVHRVAFSPKRDLIVTGAEDGTVKFSKSDGTAITMKKHSDRINDIAFSPNGNLIATAGFDGIVNLWNADGSLFKPLEGHQEHKVYSVAFSPNGELIATASRDRTVKLWKSEDGSLFKTLTGHEKNVSSVTFSRDGSLIASAGSDNKAIIWKPDGSLIRILEGHSSSIYGIAFSSDGKFIATASADQTIKLWEPDGNLVDTFEGHTDVVYNAVFSPKGNLIASVSQDYTLKLWKNNTLADTFDGYHCRRIAFSPKGDSIALACYDWKFYLLDSNATAITSKKSSSNLNSVAFNPKGDLIATGNKHGKVELWKSDGSPAGSWPAHDKPIYDITFSRNGDLIITAGGDNTIKLWELNGDLKKTLEGDKDWLWVMSVASSPREDLIASGSFNGDLKLWRSDGSSINPLEKHDGVIYSIAFSPSGDRIASASADKTIKLWKPDGTLIETLEGHGGIVTGVAFSPKGDLIASTSHDKTLKLWKPDGTLIHTFVGHDHLIESLAFSPSGDVIATVSDDGTLKLWNLNLDDLLVRGCDWVRDYLNTLPKDHENKNLCDDIK
ncbi:MAG: hypothetical protein SXA11_14835 [Cyanobacteriota bacterium]|nr:hypothetical protein [Cyanobacteriota bacterium]